MNRRRKPQFNTIEAASLARWIIIAIFVAAAGLVYVYLKVQLYHLGESRKKVETELRRVREENKIAHDQIAALTSRAALQQQLNKGYLKMVHITEQNIVRLNANRLGDNEIQPVVNRQPRK